MSSDSIPECNYIVFKFNLGREHGERLAHPLKSRQF